MEATAAGLGRACFQQRCFKAVSARQQPRPAGRSSSSLVQCCASRSPFGDREEQGQWTRHDWSLCSSNEQHCNNDWQQRQSEQAAPPSSSSSSTTGGSSSSAAAARDRWDEEADRAAADFYSAGWPANLGGADAPRPLEFYPTSQLDWDAGFVPLERDVGGSKSHGKIYVILFGVGSTDTEGIYSLRAVEQDDGLPVDTIVAFENEDDAMRYATLLEATMDHQPTVWPIQWGELLEFCNGAGYRCRLEPAGSLLIPPDYNVGMTDWEKSLRLRRGEFRVLEAEPPLVPGSAGTLADAAAALEELFARSPAAEPRQPQQQPPYMDSNVVDSQLADPVQLELLKQSLERLLPRE